MQYTEVSLQLLLPDSSAHVQTGLLGATEVGLGTVPAHRPTVLVLTVSSQILCLPEPHSTHHKALFTLTQSRLFVLMLCDQ